MSLTPRQHQILRLRALGHTNKEIAYQLGISDQTVKATVTMAYARLGVETAVEAFHHLGWLTVPEEEGAAA